LIALEEARRLVTTIERKVGSIRTKHVSPRLTIVDTARTSDYLERALFRRFGARGAELRPERSRSPASRILRHREVEYLLLGLLLEAKGIAGQLLTETGVHIDAARKTLPTGSPARLRVELSDTFRRQYHRPNREANRRGHGDGPAATRRTRAHSAPPCRLIGDCTRHCRTRLP